MYQDIVPQESQPDKRVYRTPELVEYGLLTDLTQSAKAGVSADSVTKPSLLTSVT